MLNCMISPLWVEEAAKAAYNAIPKRLENGSKIEFDFLTDEEKEEYRVRVDAAMTAYDECLFNAAGVDLDEETGYDAEIRDAVILGDRIHGTIYGDRKKRFEDGTFIHTSVIQSHHDDIYVTMNTVYKVKLLVEENPFPNINNDDMGDNIQALGG